MIGFWNTYKNAINHNCNPMSMESVETVIYWRNTLFSTTMIFVLPLCLIALIPAQLLITYENKEYITVLHLTTLGLMSFIAFMPRMDVHTRKLIFSITVFVFATFLNLFTSPSSGSVLVYFLAACIYSIIIFDNKYAFWWSHLVLFISALFGFLIHFDPLYFSHNVDMVSVNEWVAVSANLVFLCYLSSALIPKIFSGIENYIREQNRLKTELEKSKLTLQTKNIELEQFAYVASHDLQEPLRMVSRFMEMLKAKYANQLDEKGLQYIHFATDGAHRMRQVVMDLLLYSSVNAPLDQTEAVNLNDLLYDYTKLRRVLISDKQAEINYNTLPTLENFHTPISQIFHNLLDNAIKYSKTDVPPRIEILSTEKTTQWEFCIRDNGIGIDDQYFEKIFIMFQRLHDRSEFDGTGIGLAIAKRAVTFLGGEIWVESELGVGTSFYFTIPNVSNQTQ